MSQLVQLYDNILRAIGLRVDERGLISMVIEDQNFPCTVNGKRLVLPTQDVLRASRWNEWVAFHPLSENIMREPSPVLIKTRNLISFRVTHVLTELMLGLMEIAYDTNKHPTLSINNLAFLQAVPDVNKNTWNALVDILGKLEVEGQRKLVNFYPRRNADIRDQKYSRGAIITFPIVSELQNNEQEIFGVKLSKKDKQAIAAVFNWILPDAHTYQTYSSGSSSMVAPTFDSLIRGFINVAKALNKVTDAFKNDLPNAKDLYIDLSWEGELDNIARYRDLIPILDGNEGEIAIGTGDNNTKTVSTHMSTVAQSLADSQAPQQRQPVQQPTYAPPQPTAMQPARAPAPHDPRKIIINDPDFKPVGAVTINQDNPVQTTPVTANNDQDWNSFLANQQRAQMPQMPVFQAVGGPQIQPMMPQQMPMGQPTMVMTPNGPMLMPAPMNPMYAQQPMMQPQMPMMQPGQMVQLPNGMVVPMQQAMMMQQQQPQQQYNLPVFQPVHR